MRNVGIALFLGALSSCLSHVLLHVSLPWAYVFNPFIVLYFDLDASGGNRIVADLAVGALNLIPFLVFGILSIFIRRWAFGTWLFGALIIAYLGWMLSHLV